MITFLKKTNFLFFIFLLLFGLFFINNTFAIETLGGLPALNVEANENGGTTYSLSLQILLLMSALTILPSLLLGMTSFTRIVIVMSILRQALGTQQTPPNQVLIALALFLTFFIMAPTFTNIYELVAIPYMNGEIQTPDALDKASKEIKSFMVTNTRETDLSMFAEISGAQQFYSKEEIPFSIALPAFITSELKTAFQIGFLLLSLIHI